MKKHLKDFFIPHADNNYHPHILHTKRAFLYGAVGVIMKAVVFAFALFVPAQAYFLPDVVAAQYKIIIDLTNTLRQEKGLRPLLTAPPLEVSADAKAEDMAQQHYFSHTGPNGHTLAYFLKAAHYPYSVAGENLAMGFIDAASVVGAWKKSPTHYANLIDPDFKELGVGLERGTYNNEPTVFIAQHFGARKKEKRGSSASPTVATTTLGVSVPSLGAVVKSVKITANPVDEPILFDPERSRVSWEEKSDTTLLTVQVVVHGPVAAVVAYVGAYPIALHPVGTSSYFGQLEISGSADRLFKPVLMPTISIADFNGQEYEATVPWATIKKVSATSFEKYSRATKMLFPLTSLFKTSRAVYLGLIIFFGLALIINIVVEVRKQHYHIIAQTLLLIGLLVGLWWV